MVIFIYGEDTYRSRQFLKKNIEDFKKKRDPQGFNVALIDPDNIDENEIMSQVLASPFLAEKRLAVLFNPITKCSAEFNARLAELIKENKIPDTNVLIVWENISELGVKASKEAKELLAVLKAQKYSESFPVFNSKDFFAWIEGAVREAGGVIEKDAAEFLTVHAEDTWHAAGIINQALAYSGETKKITLATVQEFLDELADDNIFSLIDAIMQGNTKNVFKMLDAQINAGTYEGQIIVLVAGQIRKLFQILECMVDGVNDAGKIAEEIDAHPFVVKKLIPLAKKTTLAKLKELYNMLVDMDFKMKTSSTDFKALFALFVSRCKN